MPSTMRRRTAAVLVALSVTVCSAAASAQNATPPADDARAHFDRGLTLLNAQNYEGALAEFQRSYQLGPRPSVLYNIAVTLQALHRYPEAAQTLTQYLHDATNLPAPRRAEIQQALDQLRALIAHVALDVGSPGATVRVDGVSVGTSPITAPIEVGPGRHLVEVSMGGRPAGHAEFTIASGETRTVHVDVAPAASQVVESDNPYGNSPNVVTTPTLEIDGAPPGSTVTVDGSTSAMGEAIELAAGAHEVVIRANGRAEYRGTVPLRAGEHRRLNVRLAESSSGLPVGVFYGGAVATVALGAAAAVFAGLTVSTRAQFDQLYQDDPSINDVAARGNLFRDLTNGLLVATGVVGVATAVIFTQTRFSPAASTADIAVAPLPGGAAASVRLRF